MRNPYIKTHLPSSYIYMDFLSLRAQGTHCAKLETVCQREEHKNPGNAWGTLINPNLQSIGVLRAPVYGKPQPAWYFSKIVTNQPNGTRPLLSWVQWLKHHKSMQRAYCSRHLLFATFDDRLLAPQSCIGFTVPDPSSLREIAPHTGILPEPFTDSQGSTTIEYSPTGQRIWPGKYIAGYEFRPSCKIFHWEAVKNDGWMGVKILHPLAEAWEGNQWVVPTIAIWDRNVILEDSFYRNYCNQPWTYFVEPEHYAHHGKQP